MSWDKIDDKLKKGIDAKFVSCEEDYEIDYIRKVIQNFFPGLARNEIDPAISHCCKSIKPPRPRKAFVACLKEQLG